MLSRSFRRTARVFAAFLLIWTAADLLDYGVCVQHHSRIAAVQDAAFRASGEHAPSPEADDCFCCSHMVDVGNPFNMWLLDTVAWVLPEHAAFAAALNAPPLYHPPLG